MSIFIFLILAYLAEIVGTMAGFGATTILVPVSSFFIPLKEAIPLVALFHFFGTIWRTLFFARGINFRLVFLWGVPSLLFAALGAYLFTITSGNILSRLLGIFLITYAFLGLTGHKITLPHRDWLAAVGGAVVGFTAGLVGVAGPLRGAFLASWDFDRNRYLGTGAAIGLGAELTRLGVYTTSGFLSVTPTLIILLLLVSFLGTFSGRRIIMLTPQRLFAKIVFVALLLAGVRFLIV